MEVGANEVGGESFGSKLRRYVDEFSRSPRSGCIGLKFPRGQCGGRASELEKEGKAVEYSTNKVQCRRDYRLKHGGYSGERYVRKFSFFFFYRKVECVSLSRGGSDRSRRLPLSLTIADQPNGEGGGGGCWFPKKLELKI